MKRIQHPPRAPRSRLQVDWRAHFRAFMEAHGRPVEFGAVLIFRDGWRHSADDWSGPVWPPPNDPVELRNVKRVYWNERLKAAERERAMAQADLEALLQLQAVRTAPIMVRVQRRDVSAEGLPVVKTESVEARVEDFELLLRERTRDVQECWEHLNQLEREAA